MKRDSPKQLLIMCAFGLIPVVWLGLIVAPAISGGKGLAGGLSEILQNLTAALENPLAITWCEGSIKTVLIFIAAYVMGIGIYFATRRNTRPKEEHGSAKWGEAAAVNKKYADVEKYQNFDTLTNAMLNEFVEKIHVHKRDRKGSIETTQQVEIFFNFVGRYVPPRFGEVVVTPEKLEEQRKIEERKDRLHQNYLRRKENGKQKEYEDRIKAAKKAEMDAKKNALRSEDIAKGIFIPVSTMPKAEPQKAERTA